ncbi:rhomboid family intramembrane serine protease [Luteolibacter ambystomatis]|uniref:Rhomboid family intramembrane serine protease n=1 Tax=Luteolibacter ambystomatis TaxID=2824561 RepID=A0A975IXP7_9BACT|nr:rhomboid family intramembrane serine protease [Luteolibacter ambystomatis]QUE49412.1 rhomboid family intramembrane serine protease [Luteolibacter ambystomatis]
MNRLVARAHGVGRGFGQLGRARLPWLIVLVILGIQAAVESYGGHARLGPLFRLLGLSQETIGMGWLWQIGTYALLHGNWLHAGLNAFCLLLLGTRVEHVLGRRILLRAVFLAILGGAAGHLLFASRYDVTLVGISGAAYGLLLLVTTLSPESTMWPLMVSGRWVGIGLLAASALLALMDPALGLPLFSNGGRYLAEHGLESWWALSHGCHFGGGLAGWLYGRWLLRPRVTLEKLRRERERREGLGRRSTES